MDGETVPLLVGKHLERKGAPHCPGSQPGWNIACLFIALVGVLTFVSFAVFKHGSVPKQAMPSTPAVPVTYYSAFWTNAKLSGDGQVESKLLREFVNLRYKVSATLDPGFVIKLGGVGSRLLNIATQIPTSYSMFDLVVHLRDSPLAAISLSGGPLAENLHVEDDLLIARDSKLFTSAPVNVFCLPHKRSLAYLIKNTLDLLPDLEPKQCRTLVLAGEDTRLSANSDNVKLVQQSKKFSQIYYEAKDVELEGVNTIPMGFISFYLLLNGAQNVYAAVQEVVNKQKSKLVAAAWGHNYSDETLLKFGETSRVELNNFVEANTWLSRTEFRSDQYWHELSDFHFNLAPAGAGVQAPKLAESWLLRVVPITLRVYPAFQDLKDQGFPIILLDTWSDLTQNMLEEYLESTEYKDIDWENIANMLRMDVWSKKYLCQQ